MREKSVDIRLSSGATLMIPLSSLPPQVRQATPRERSKARVVGYGTAIHWDRLGEGILLAHVFGVPEDELYVAAGFHDLTASGSTATGATGERLDQIIDIDWENLRTGPNVTVGGSSLTEPLNVADLEAAAH
ncbi:MAG: DUF2442 domain-containing protein [Chloroflexota bacterium]|nr:DUF2442 domain-containing protein [Chloroflexota bacterium]